MQLALNDTYKDLAALQQGLYEHRVELIHDDKILREVSTFLINELGDKNIGYSAAGTLLAAAAHEGRVQLRMAIRDFVRAKRDLAWLLKSNSAAKGPASGSHTSGKPGPGSPSRKSASKSMGFYAYFTDADRLISVLALSMPSLIMSRELHPFMDDNPFASDYSVPTAETSAKFIRWMISQGDPMLYEAVKAWLLRQPSGTDVLVVEEEEEEEEENGKEEKDQGGKKAKAH